jgi:hypothetical protein
MNEKESARKRIARWRRRTPAPPGWPPDVPYYRWTIPDDPEERRELGDLIKLINKMRLDGPTQERQERAEKLLRAYHARSAGGRKAMEDDDTIRAAVEEAERLREQGWTVEQIAERQKREPRQVFKRLSRLGRKRPRPE